MTKAHEVVAAYWAAAEARDWTRFGELVADDRRRRHPVLPRPQAPDTDIPTRGMARLAAAQAHLAVDAVPGATGR
ncbi:MAG: hypothetical protein GEV12_00960 [Micromonosporaceae bacterium]|nr:hypothetical protein [Micromonosporaceae bacterium]